jgi:hypothetical protein
MRQPKFLARGAVILPLLAIGLSHEAVAGPQNVLTNGNFDTAPGNSAVSTQFGSAGYAAMPGWTVTNVNGSTPFDLWWVAASASTVSALTQYGNSGQELVSSFPGADGTNPYFVGLDGDSRASGTLSQTVSNLIVGDHYQLTFDWAATQMTTGSHNPYSIAVAFNLGTSALTSGNGVPQTSTVYEAYGQSSKWTTVTYTFTATSATEILSFLALGLPIGGPPIALLDDITLDDIPEPSSLALVGGVVLLGVMARRRRARALADG